MDYVSRNNLNISISDFNLLLLFSLDSNTNICRTEVSKKEGSLSSSCLYNLPLLLVIATRKPQWSQPSLRGHSASSWQKRTEKSLHLTFRVMSCLTAGHKTFVLSREQAKETLNQPLDEE